MDRNDSGIRSFLKSHEKLAVLFPHRGIRLDPPVPSSTFDLVMTALEQSPHSSSPVGSSDRQQDPSRALSSSARLTWAFPRSYIVTILQIGSFAGRALDHNLRIHHFEAM
jgi:hypothetical protein